MTKLINNQKVSSIWKTLRPWLLALVFVVILRYTGAISGISFLAQSALMETGVMNADPARTTAPSADFDYGFTIADLQGNQVDVSKFRDKVIFLNMWATWCGPCRAEMPSIQSLYESVDKDKVVFIMLALDNEENQAKIPKYIKDKEFTFPVYVPHQYLPKQLQVSSIPTTFIIGRDGKVKSKKVGAAKYDTDKFRKFMDELTK